MIIVDDFQKRQKYIVMVLAWTAALDVTVAELPSAD